jgi:F420-non-reducing hydrogenase iron-sulfur subunit
LHQSVHYKTRIDDLEDSIAMAANGNGPSSEGRGWEPNIIAFCCRHCAYAAADLAGGLRLKYPASVKVVELPCTGKFDVLYALRAFEDGADGAMVSG